MSINYLMKVFKVITALSLLLVAINLYTVKGTSHNAQHDGPSNEPLCESSARTGERAAVAY